MFLAIDRVSKFSPNVEFRNDMGKMNGADFLRGVIKTFPHKIHTVLTDNGMAFADLPKNRDKSIHVFLGMHIFGRVCNENGIAHKLTKPYHPWTNGQAERMNRTIRKTSIKAFHYPDLDSLKAHVLANARAFNFAKHFKALRWKTPYQTIVEAWQKNLAIFKVDPRHLIPGPYSEAISKEDLFYYIYGLFHSEDYKKRYADNLSKELPRIPAVKKFADFQAFSTAGRKLADLHI